jgi:hypothetical protein
MFLLGLQRSMTVSYLRSLAARVIGGIERLQSAGAVAAAVEAHRRPRAADLRRLGIDPAAFTSIGHG